MFGPLDRGTMVWNLQLLGEGGTGQQTTKVWQKSAPQMDKWLQVSLPLHNIEQNFKVSHGQFLQY
jgi:hypothetical protein